MLDAEQLRAKLREIQLKALWEKHGGDPEAWEGLKPLFDSIQIDPNGDVIEQQFRDRLEELKPIGIGRHLTGQPSDRPVPSLKTEIADEIDSVPGWNPPDLDDSSLTPSMRRNLGWERITAMREAKYRSNG